MGMVMDTGRSRLDEFEGTEVGNADLVDAIMAGARQVSLLRERAEQARGVTKGMRDSLLDASVSAGLLSVNMLLAASAARCRQNPPPPADIEMVTDATGRLIYRCQHATPHKWALDGTPI